MKTSLKRILTVALAVLMVVPMFIMPTAAANITYVNGANSVSSSYKNGKYYQYLTSLPYTGNNRTDVLAVALSQLGYQEGASAGNYSGTVGGGNNYTEFNYNMGNWGVGYGGSSAPWCAMFVTWCLRQSKVNTIGTGSANWCRNNTGNKKYIWCEIGCPAWVTQLKKWGYWKASKYAGGSYTPLPGDLIFFRYSSSATPAHIGMVLYATSSTIYTVEGNTSSGTGLEANGGGVYFKSYSANYSNILGYGAMPYNANATIDYSGSKPTAGLYMSSTLKYLYKDAKATTAASVNLPAYTLFKVTGVASGSGLSAVLKCEYNGSTYYVKNNSTDRIIQVSATSSSSGDSGSTGGSTDSGSTDSGNTGSGSTDSGNTGGTTTGVYGTYAAKTKINVRASASSSGTAIGYINKGHAVQVLETSGIWGKIVYNNGYGWIHLDYMTTDMTTANTGSTATHTVTTNSDPLNVRDTASSTGTVIGAVNKGATVYVFSVSSGWAQIYYNDSTQNQVVGYCSASYLTECVYTPVAPPVTAPDALTLVTGSAGTLTSTGLYKDNHCGTTYEDIVSSFNEDDKYITVTTASGTKVTSGAVATGYVVNLTIDGKVVDSYVIVVTGDVNGDGLITSVDLMAAAGHLSSSYTLSGAYASAADKDSSGDIDSSDYLSLKNLVD